MKTYSLAVVILTSSTMAQAAPPTADELLDRMDDTLQFDTRKSEVTMVVKDSRRTRTYSMVSFGRGQDEAAVEYTAPARDKATKMLKKGDNLWLYLPRAERTQKISGHMLRQGMMGSDISYEDMMDAADFRKKYTAEVVGDELMHDRPCWKLEAKARDRTVSYPRRLIWVDKETFIPRRQELYALSDMLLKTWTMTDVEKVEGRWVAMRMEIKDRLRKGSSTTLQLQSVTFGVPLQKEIFTRRWLERRR